MLELAAGAALAQELEEFAFSLNRFAVGDRAAYWVGLDKGYVARAGLDVTLENATASADSVAKVDSGRADAGLADTVAATCQAFAKLHKIDESAVTRVNIEPTAKIAAQVERRVDIIIRLRPLQHGHRRQREDDEGAPEGAARLPRNRLHGSARRDGRSERGARDLQETCPQIELSIIEPNLMLALDLIRTKNYADRGIGWIDDKTMCGAVGLVNTYMGVAKKVDCKAVYTTEFLTKMTMPVAAK